MIREYKEYRHTPSHLFKPQAIYMVTGATYGKGHFLSSDKKKEHFQALLLDTRGQLIRIAEISVGSLDTSIVHPREVFKETLSSSAASVIFVHNHPSGDPKPSEDDIKLTERLAQAGEVMGIDVLDHIIIGNKGYLSLKREGLF